MRRVMLFAFFLLSLSQNLWWVMTPCHTHPLRRFGRWFQWFVSDSTVMTPLEAARCSALVCEIKMFSVLHTVKPPISPALPYILIICASFCHFIQPDEISHRLSHLLCLRLICLLAGSHRSMPKPGGFLQRRIGYGLSGQLSSMIHHISH